MMESLMKQDVQNGKRMSSSPETTDYSTPTYDAVILCPTAINEPAR
jgi:hypothetical protein